MEQEDNLASGLREIRGVSDDAEGKRGDEQKMAEAQRQAAEEPGAPRPKGLLPDSACLY